MQFLLISLGKKNIICILEKLYIPFMFDLIINQNTEFLMQFNFLYPNFESTCYLYRQSDIFSYYSPVAVHVFVGIHIKVSGPFVETSCVFLCVKNIINAEMWA